MTWRVDDPGILAGHFRSQAQVFGPVRSGDGTLLFRELRENDSIDLSGRTDISARNVMQPVTHYFLHFDSVPGAEPEFRDIPAGKRIVLGVRPCDVASIRVFDRVFSESESFRKLRADTIIVGYLCNSRESSCFCEAVGGSPGERTGMDMALYRGSDSILYLEALTDRGTAVMDGSGMPECANPPEPTLAGPGEAVEVPSDIDRIAGMADDSLWEKVSFPCVNCRICTYVCPTCHCFTVTDEVFADRGARAVVWDSCQSREFTLEASGHNPREAGLARARQRIMHKFAWYPSTADGELMCSGCGRCISGCPTGRDIREDLSIIAGEV